MEMLLEDLYSTWIFKDTRWSTGAFIRYRFHPLFAVQGGVTYARIQGMDSNSENRARRGRNLNFKNDMFDSHGKT